MRRIVAGLVGVVLPWVAAAQGPLTVEPRDVVDQKAVFATVESPNVVPARARIGGTVVGLSVRDGDAVAPGQAMAVIGDEKIALQIAALDAQIAGLQSQLAQAQADLARAETLFRQGSGTRVALDQARTAGEVAAATLRARTADRAVLRQSVTEGAVLAPVAGRVLQVPLTQGSVVMAGDPVAMVAEQRFKLRLRVPEVLAATLKPGDPVRLDAGQLGIARPLIGRITLVYPQISEGRVVADAEVEGLGDYFVGARLRVWIGAGTRRAIVVPSAYVVTRVGLDYVRLKTGNAVAEIPVQRGQESGEGVEILSGLRGGDVLVVP